MRPWNGVVRGSEPPQHRRYDLAYIGGSRYLFGARTRDQNVARRPFLEQEFRRPNNWLGVEPGAHRSVVEGVIDRYQRHPLVMRHVSSNDCYFLTLGETRRCVIERFVAAITTHAARRSEAGKVARCSFRIDHRGQGRRVRRNHDILTESALEPQSGNAKV